MDRKTCSLFRKVDYHPGPRHLPMNGRKKGVESECRKKKAYSPIAAALGGLGDPALKSEPARVFCAIVW
jgi:hypothetical protein